MIDMDLGPEAAPVQCQRQAQRSAAAMAAGRAHEDGRRLAPDGELLAAAHRACARSSAFIAIRQAEGPQVKSVVCR